MAPEQASGERDTDHRIDIYQAGLVMYEMLAGRPPFVSESTREVILAHVSREPPPLTRADAPARLIGLVMRCLEKGPAQRPPT